MSIIRFNPIGTDPPFVVVGSASMPVGTRNLDATVNIDLGILANNVYEWNFATNGSSTNIGSINLIAWYEFREITESEFKANQKKELERIEQLNQELKDQEWYKLKMKELKKQLKDTSK